RPGADAARTQGEPYSGAMCGQRPLSPGDVQRYRCGRDEQGRIGLHGGDGVDRSLLRPGPRFGLERELPARFALRNQDPVQADVEDLDALREVANLDRNALAEAVAALDPDRGDHAAARLEGETRRLHRHGYVGRRKGG